MNFTEYQRKAKTTAKYPLYRVYRNGNDLQLMLDLSIRVRPEEFKHDYPNKADLEEDLASREIRARTRLWFDEDRLIAWAYVDDFQNLRWEVEGQYNNKLGYDIVEWGVKCAHEIPGVSTLDASCSEEYAERIEFLEKYGFKRTEKITIHMERDLLQLIPRPKIPKGFAIRAVAGTEEAEKIASLHRAAFGTEYMTTENRLAIMNTSAYDPSLDLVAIAPDGTFAAYCTCSVSLEKRMGSTDPVATHPHYQRLGLARALLLSGFRLLKERGMQKAVLGTSVDNVAMQRTAESVGFYIAYKTLWFEKRIALQ